jgi:Ca2+-binding EF-hand superfamily protein
MEVPDMGMQLLTSGLIMFTCATAGAPTVGHPADEPQAFASAGVQQRRAPARMRFEVMDQDGDGEISRQEWRGSARSFDVHDWNGDGRLSGDEVRLGGRPQDDVEQADHAPSRAERYMSWTERGFTNLDHDRNRRITSDEWHYDRETFVRADRNRDGTLDETEFIGGDMDDDRGDRFDDLDVNGNGRVERREWHASDDAFTWLDRNGDGILSRTEVVGDAAGGQSGQFTGRDVTVTVDARRRWTDTQLDVRAGDVLSFSSRGSIQMSTNGDDIATPAGSRTGRGAAKAPVNAVAGALIARIGNGAPFLIGDRTTITVSQTGRLQLGVNDDYLEDNQGDFEVVVGMPRRTSVR